MSAIITGITKFWPGERQYIYWTFETQLSAFQVHCRPSLWEPKLSLFSAICCSVFANVKWLQQRRCYSNNAYVYAIVAPMLMLESIYCWYVHWDQNLLKWTHTIVLCKWIFCYYSLLAANRNEFNIVNDKPGRQEKSSSNTTNSKM